MATAYGPSIVRDGLVLALDAANPKSILNTVEVLVVAGGGGGGTGGGGGGAGGLLYSSSYSVAPGTAIAVTIGNGGASTSTWGGQGTNGGNSVFGALTAIGGGAGGHRYSGSTQGTGGSGGGNAGGTSGSGTVTMANGTSGQGFTGGSSIVNGSTQEEPGGGGGGAGGKGADSIIPASTSAASAQAALPGAGGTGLLYSISGTPTYYAGGGGGSNRTGTGASGGLGGGGAGGTSPVAGTSGLGGGGGGTGYSGYGGGGTSAAGGSGVVIVRYFGPARATGGTITSVGGYTIHSFTTVGSTTFTPNATWSDLSGNANSGTLTDGPTYSSANGGYIAFNGTSNYITNSTNLFSGRTTTTGAYWVYITAYPSGNVGVLHMWNGVSQLAYDTTSGGIPQFWINGALIVSGNQLSLNTWHYMTWVTDGAFARIYTNGVLVNSGAFTAAIATSAQPMYIFRRSDSATYMAGRLSSLSVYNRALSAAEIQQNFNAHRGRYGV